MCFKSRQSCRLCRQPKLIRLGRHRSTYNTPSISLQIEYDPFACGRGVDVALGYSFQWLLRYLRKRRSSWVCFMSPQFKIFLPHLPCIFIYQSVLILFRWCCVLFRFKWPFSSGSSDEQINASLSLHVGSPSASTPAKVK